MPALILCQIIPISVSRQLSCLIQVKIVLIFGISGFHLYPGHFCVLFCFCFWTFLITTLCDWDPT